MIFESIAQHSPQSQYSFYLSFQFDSIYSVRSCSQSEKKKKKEKRKIEKTLWMTMKHSIKLANLILFIEIVAVTTIVSGKLCDVIISLSRVMCLQEVPMKTCRFNSEI